MVAKSERSVVFTALLGNYERLLDQPVAKDSTADFICFTDDRSLTSTDWEVVLIDPLLPLDMVRSQRALKIRGHRRLEDYGRWLYIDNAVLLRKDPIEILDDWLSDADYAVSRHSFRDVLIDEFDAVAALQYDDAARIAEQLLHYAELYPDLLEGPVYWNGMIARRNTAAVHRMASLWFDHVLRYSRRDQLSATVAIATSGLAVRVLDENNNDSPTHQWPAGVDRKAELGIAPSRRTGPMLAELRRLHNESGALRQKADAAVHRENDEIRVELDRANAALEALNYQILHARSRPAALETLYGVGAARLVTGFAVRVSRLKQAIVDRAKHKKDDGN